MRAWTLAAALVLLAACRKGAEQTTCAAMRERFVACGGDPSAGWSLQRHCAVALKRPAATAAGYAAMFSACAKVPDCAGLRACIDLHHCNFIVEGPGDDTPELTCPP